MEKVSFEIEINGVTKSINSINEAKEAISELQDIMDNSTFGSEEFKNAATQIDKLQNKLVEALDKGVEPATDGFKKLKNELKEAKNAQAQAAEAFGEGSKEYKAAAQQVANLQDKLDDLKDSSVSLKGTGIEKLNASIGLFKEGILNADTDKLKVGFNALGAAMKAIPIFLLIEGLRLLWENFDKVSEFAKKFFNLQSDGEKQIIKLNKQLKEQEEATKALSGSIEREIKLLEAQGASTDKIIEAKKRLALEQLKELDLQGKLAVAKIREIASNDDSTESVYKYAAALARAQGNTQAAEIWERKYTEAKRERMSEEVKNANEINQKIKDIDNSLKVSKISNEKEAKDKLKELRTENIKDERKKLMAEFENEVSQIKATGELKNQIKAEIEIKYQNKLKDLNKKSKEDTKKEKEDLFAEALKEQEKEEEIRSWRIKKEEEANKLEAANRAKVLEEMKALELKVMQEENQAKIDAWNEEERLRKERQAAEEKEKQDRISMANELLRDAQNFTNGLNALNDFALQVKLNNNKKGFDDEEKVRKKQFDLNKKIQIGQALISGAQGVLTALTAKSLLPEPIATIARATNAASIVAATGLTIAKIDGMTYESKGSAGSSTTGVPAVSGNAPQFNSIAPNINPSANQPLTRLDENGRPINVNTSVKVEAEVTESKMTDKQKQQQQRINNTTF